MFTFNFQINFRKIAQIFHQIRQLFIHSFFLRPRSNFFINFEIQIRNLIFNNFQFFFDSNFSILKFKNIIFDIFNFPIAPRYFILYFYNFGSIVKNGKWVKIGKTWIWQKSICLNKFIKRRFGKIVPCANNNLIQGCTIVCLLCLLDHFPDYAYQIIFSQLCLLDHFFPNYVY